MCASCSQGDVGIVRYVSPNIYALEDLCCHLNIILAINAHLHSTKREQTLEAETWERH